MDKQECISQLEDLKKHCMDWSPESPWDKDVEALDIAIAILKETAQEVPVQEQLLEIKIDGKTIASSILKTHDS
ncbi:hypothetical protein [Clostridium sp. UBA3887]|uniref:hypothetical protein n=1 Tax=Clostridium sp. UBA3887 TaxID=1946356 RepID=UPI003216A034